MKKKITNNKSQITNNKTLRVLFVASGNGKVNGVSSFIKAQYESLVNAGLDMRMYVVNGHGVLGYLRNWKQLRAEIRDFQPHIVHAHYSLCGFLTSLAILGLRYPKSPISNNKSQITNHKSQIPRTYCSIMGGFPEVGVKHVRIKRFFVRLFANHIWDGTLAKSQISADQIGGARNVHIVPNGINLQQFAVTDKLQARKELGLDPEKKYIIFPTFPKRFQKNYPLAEAAVRDLLFVICDLLLVTDEPEKCLATDQIEFRVLYDMLHDEVVKWMCAADVTLMTSRWEGSPNVIKEAMAVNCPIVSTVCGDVPWLIDGVEGCYLVTENTPEAVAENLRQALTFANGTKTNPQGRTLGREKIMSLHLTTEEVAQKLIGLYEEIM